MNVPRASNHSLLPHMVLGALLLLSSQTSFMTLSQMPEIWWCCNCHIRHAAVCAFCRPYPCFRPLSIQGCLGIPSPEFKEIHHSGENQKELDVSDTKCSENMLRSVLQVLFMLSVLQCDKNTTRLRTLLL